VIESVVQWKRASIQSIDGFESPCRHNFYQYSIINSCAVLAHSLHSLITSTNRPKAHVDEANARQKRPPTFFLKCNEFIYDLL
jgi:hypothetical protein